MSSRSLKVTLSSVVLNWARKTRFGKNIDEASIKLKVTPETILGWETSDPTVTISQLKKISKVYNRHVSVLLLKSAPKSLQPPKFRKFPIFENLEFTSETFDAIRHAQEIQNIAIDLRENVVNESIKTLKKYSSVIPNLVKKFSELANVTDELRFKGKTSTEQLRIWKRMMGYIGVIVLEIKFSTEDCRAFTLYNDIAPVIVLNGRDTDNGRVFSLFHEFCHLVFGHTDLDEEYILNNKSGDTIEVLCNQFAGDFLVPRELLFPIAQKEASFNDTSVKKIANFFKVSAAVIWRRLLDCDLITKPQYKSANNKPAYFEPFKSNEKKITYASRNTHLYVTMKRKGELFISEVFDAYNKNKITYYDMVDYIGLKPQSITELQRLMFA